MTRMTIPPAAFALTSPHAAMAQEIAPAERAAYPVSYDKYCKGIFPGGGIIRCLARHYDNLADAFKKGRQRKQDMTEAKVTTPT